jgi:Asp/Glu/hydantoin racemase
MLRVKAIAPLRLGDAEVVRRQERYTRLGGPDLAITLVNLAGADAPERFDSAAEIAASDRLTAAEIERTDPADFDVAMPDCVLDPAIVDQTDFPVPVAGILRLVAGHLASLGRPFAVVTRNQVIGDELAARLDRYALGGWLDGRYVLDVDFCLISDHQAWSAAMKPLEARLTAAGARTLFNGCSAVDLDTDRLGDVTVVDPTSLALRLLAVAGEAGVFR